MRNILSPKRISAAALIMCALWLSQTYAFDADLLDLRNKLFEESKSIQFRMSDSPDAAIMLTLWDSAVLTITRMNAYFYMLGIFDAVKDQDMTDAALSYLVSWLQETKRANFMNISNLNGCPPESLHDPGTGKYIDQIKKYYTSLDSYLDKELAKMSVLKQAGKLGKK